MMAIIFDSRVGSLPQRKR